MILADKILYLRKRCGWSQEDLAEKVNVSRQAVSKWESAASIPDINKILELSNVFGVSTDYLLKDDVEQAEFTGSDEDAVRKVALDEANAFIEARKKSGRRIALGVVLCILSPVLLILLAGVSETSLWNINLSGGLAAGIGLAALLIMVATAVAVFIMSGDSRKAKQLVEGDFELDYGVTGVLGERRTQLQDSFTRKYVIGVVMCILSVLPLITAGIAGASDMVCIALTCLLLLIVAVAVHIFITTATEQGAYDLLLREGEFAKGDASQRREKLNRIGGFYWPVITAAYLIWSFATNDWQTSWAIWPAAALLYAGICAAVK